MWLDYGATLCQPDVFDRALAARIAELRDVKIRSAISMRPRAVLDADADGKHVYWVSQHFSGYDRRRDLGLVYRVFADATFLQDVRALASGFAKGPALAYRLIKDAFRKSLENDIAAQLKLEAELQRQAGTSRDFREAVEAFKSKRPPVFGNRRY